MRTIYLAAVCVMCASTVYATPGDSVMVSDLDQVVITGTRTKHTLANTPVVTRVITSEDLTRIDATNIQDVLLAELPGVEFSYAMNQQLTMRMQGFGGLSILILIDGERLAGETLDNTDFKRIDMADVERIEIVKGAASALYGSNSVGAVINIITKSQSRPWQLSLATRIGARNAENRNTMNFGLHHKEWTNFFNVQTNHVNTFRLEGRDGTTSRNIYGSRQWNFRDKLMYRFGENHQLTGKAGYYFNEFVLTPEYRNRARAFSGSIRYDGKIGGGNLELSYHGDRYDKSDYYQEKKKDLLDYKNMQHTFRVLYNLEWKDKLTLSMGGDLMSDYLYSYQFQDVGSRKQVTADLLMQADWTIDKHWSVVAGLRADYFTKYGWEISPKLSAMWRWRNLRWRSSYSKGFRAPSLKEMYMDFNMANVFNIYGNTDLKSERSHSFSTSLEYFKGRYSATVTLYHNILKDEISTMWNKELDNGRGAMKYYNVGGTRLGSIDVALNARYKNGVSWKLNYSYFKEYPYKGERSTSDSRPHTLTWQVAYKNAWKIYALDVSLQGRYLSKVNYWVLDGNSFDGYEAASSAGYQVWKLYASHKLWNWLTVSTTVDNLFNYRPREVLYNSLFSQGTTCYLGVKVDIDRLF